MKIREPAVSGKFYPEKAEELDYQLSTILEKERPYIDKSLFGKTVIGGVVPHAGYMFSGYEAVHFFETLRHAANKPETFIIINPNHTGYGSEVALDGNNYWNSPYGKVPINLQLTNKLPFQKSDEAHKFEHSGEVMLPMLQYFLDYPFQIVPITLGKQSPENSKIIADSLMEITKEKSDNYCIIASSDFSHYISPAAGKAADWPVIENILEMDAMGVYDQVKKKHLSICGYGPIMSLMHYSKNLKIGVKTKLLRYGHSGEVVPSDKVVDYASILFYT